MANKLNTATIITVIISIIITIVFLTLSRTFFSGIEESHAARPVSDWKAALKPVGFIGVVSDKGKFSFTDRVLFSIEVKTTALQNADSIPKDCEFFTYESGTLKFAAYSETVNRWEKYGLEEGYFIEKKVNNDTMFVYTPDHKPKYVFELFDGIVNRWQPRQWSLARQDDY